MTHHDSDNRTDTAEPSNAARVLHGQQLLNDVQLADALGICRAHVHRLTARGMPSYKLGRARRYRLDEVLAWADANDNEAA